jgi:nitrate reductase gamma subunit
LLRRLARADMRKISTPDDYFCLVLLAAWMVSGVLAAPLKNETFLLAFFGLATFFLVYVPFSKISHYVYYPFIRYYVGKHFGHRGVFPKKGTIKSTGGVVR